ncbi:MAG: rod shape-determining protein RodA [Gammaproteobacteria bacterium]|nr:rod shape-determining protein RodA [Gammaproteobacteria bacterium]MBU6509248.1 rod shape-determining protein RodA [Gammaproteobacteria bacterium]MDE1983189.1 rod shape-determining protein RodA [Gammaproteobacteria bacterium]MDE2109414.1 rod shape-determining protein RodA [Gammaproteobacteria bacterium]MDE2459639.1 rod shape-determining protein RodA [Gammaproteobacteria bacterium]
MLNVFASAPPRGDASLGEQLLQRLHLDGQLLLALIVLSLAGLAILYGASNQDTGMVYRQAVRVALSFVVLLAVAQISPQFLRQWSPWLFALGLMLLLFTLHSGHIGRGAQRWLSLGVVRFQPSEIMKIAVPMMVAWYLHDRPLPPNWKQLLPLAAMIFIPVLLVAIEPDLGTALLILSAGAFAVFLAGLRLRVILLIAVALAIATPIVWHFMHVYQRERLLTFLDPQRDPLGAGYHIIQSQIAIGSGGMFGKGWLHGSQSQLDFLPESSTDFIYAVLGEQFGFIGAIVLLALYGFIIARSLLIALRAQDTYSRLLAGAITMALFTYVFINSGMVSGILPVVGVPLPLVSYGGSSLVTLMAGFGMLMSIHSHRKLLAT